jgi:hypothetical protein
MDKFRTNLNCIACYGVRSVATIQLLGCVLRDQSQPQQTTLSRLHMFGLDSWRPAPRAFVSLARETEAERALAGHWAATGRLQHNREEVHVGGG